jgi:hypothetical protein
MGLTTETLQLAEAVRLACIELRTKINGNATDLSGLTTTAKGNLVLAINELAGLIGSGGASAWDDITGKPAAVTALTGTNTGDQDISGKLDSATAASTYAPISTTVTTSGAQPVNGTKTFGSLATNGTVVFGAGTTFFADTDAATSARSALATNDAANITTGNIAVARIATALATPGAIGGTTPAAISATTVTASGAVVGAVGSATATTLRLGSSPDGWYSPGSGQFAWASANNPNFNFIASQFRISSSSGIRFMGTSDVTAGSTEGTLSRYASGVWQFGTTSNGDAGSWRATNGTLLGTLAVTGDVALGKTITAAATTGAQTINKTSGSVNFAAAATSLVVTNSLCTANSVVHVTCATNDTTATGLRVVAGAGSFTIYFLTAPTAETRVNFLLTN